MNWIFLCLAILGRDGQTGNIRKSGRPFKNGGNISDKNRWKFGLDWRGFGSDRLLRQVGGIHFQKGVNFTAENYLLFKRQFASNVCEQMNNRQSTPTSLKRKRPLYILLLGLICFPTSKWLDIQTHSQLPSKNTSDPFNFEPIIVINFFWQCFWSHRTLRWAVYIWAGFRQVHWVRVHYRRVAFRTDSVPTWNLLDNESP